MIRSNPVCSSRRLWGALVTAVAVILWDGLATGLAPKDVPPPRSVTPGVDGAPPSDAVVLFDGTDLSKWKNKRTGGPAKWNVSDGVLTVVPREGDITTRDSYGDIQFHIEWATPPRGDRKGGGENVGNSGIKFHEAYEIQILDSFGGSRRPMGQAGAVYKQHAPLVNACRKPGEWQTYDIIFRAPRFDQDGKRVKRGRFTVFHNGVLIQDNVPIQGRTNSPAPVKPEYKQPLFLQAHGNPVRFRNIWLRELEPRKED